MLGNLTIVHLPEYAEYSKKDLQVEEIRKQITKEVTPDHFVVHVKLTQCYVSYTSIKPQRKKLRAQNVLMYSCKTEWV